jgi:hypothetical protein
VKTLRVSLSAVRLVITLIVMTNLSAFAAVTHPVCPVHHQHCSNDATIKSCCERDQNTAPDQTGPLAEKVTVGAPSMVVAVLFPIVAAPEPTHALVRAQASSPRAAPVDLPTLYATLLV